MDAIRYDIVKSTKSELNMIDTPLQSNPERTCHFYASVCYLPIAGSVFVAAGKYKGDLGISFDGLTRGVREVWRLDLLANEWSKEPNETAVPRFKHSACVNGKLIWLFGGSTVTDGGD